ncbi:MAG: OmpA family protein [Bacteroidota bacterium]
MSKKQFASLQDELNLSQRDLAVTSDQLQECRESVDDYIARLASVESEKESLQVEVGTVKSNLQLREEQIADLRDQVSDFKSQRDKQLSQVGDLTVLTREANQNIKETLSQLESRDEYIKYLLGAKSKADSINLALAVNLKSVLAQGIADQDVDIQVDKTVVFVNLSDKMLYQSGSSLLTPRANEVLGKIAQIIESRPELEVMVEGYTDNVPIKSSCMNDNWDLSVKRATSVVRVLQERYNIDPNRLIAAGRGEYNALASNDTADGRAINRRTRIIILPKLNQFYDLLDPELATGN